MAPSVHHVAFTRDGRRLTFVLRGASLPVANGIVRAILADVQTVAFDAEPLEEGTFQVLVNTRPGGLPVLHDAMIKSRIALCPIHFTADEVDAFRREKYSFELHVKVPRDHVGLRDVTARDFVVRDEDGKDLGRKFADRLFPVDPVTGDAVLLARLSRGDELHVKGLAAKASGRRHAAFEPAAQCGLSHVRDEGAVAKAAAAIKDAEARAAFLALDANRLVETGPDGEPHAFRITLRSKCGMTPKDIVRRALLHLRTRVAAAAQAVEAVASQTGGEIQPDDVEIKASDEGHTVITFLKGEDATLGEIMQYHVLAVGGPDAFAAYVAPHPLSERMLFRLKGDAALYQQAAASAEKELTATLKAADALP